MGYKSDKEPSVAALCHHLFPSVSFDGGSDIHASICDDRIFNYYGHPAYALVKGIHRFGLAATFSETIMSKFSKMEFLISSIDLQEIMLGDIYKYLTNSYTLGGRGTLKNPVTGNYFHKIAVMGNLVGGVRAWAYTIGDRLVIGFRFRLEKRVDTTAALRGTIEEEVKEANEVTTSITISEPYEEETPLRVRVQE